MTRYPASRCPAIQCYSLPDIPLSISSLENVTDAECLPVDILN